MSLKILSILYPYLYLIIIISSRVPGYGGRVLFVCIKLKLQLSLIFFFAPEFLALGSIFISNLQSFSYGHHVFMIWRLRLPFSTPKMFGGPHLSLVSGSIVPSREDYLVYPSTFPQSPLGDTQCHDRSA